MSILCGIDFSESSAGAADVAGAIAARLATPLHLVHSLADWPGEVYPEEKRVLLTVARRSLEKQAERLRGLGVEVHLRVELDSPEKALLGVAKEESVTLIVIGATGHGRTGAKPVGRTADHLAQQCHVPTLVVKAVEPFTRWMKGEKPLRVVVGLDFNLVSDDAWHWAEELAHVGPVEVVGVHVYWPPSEFHRLGLGGMRSYVDSDPEVERVLRREFEGRFQASRGASVRLRFEPGLGRPSDHVLSIAIEEKADLVVVGSHQRHAVNRLWEGSVSRGVLHDSESAVACIPLSTAGASRRGPEVRAVLAATDFSATGNASLEHAYAQVGRGGKVHLVHVLAPTGHRSELEPRDIFFVAAASADAKKSAEEKLRALIPPGSLIHDKLTEVLVLESRDPAGAITQAAERLGVDLICLGTQGRSGIARTILGSVAQAVLSKTERPVLLVRAPPA